AFAPASLSKVYHAQAYLRVIWGTPMKCQESPFKVIGWPFNSSLLPANVNCRQPKRWYLMSAGLPLTERFSSRPLRLGVSGLQSFRAPSTFEARVTVRISPGD